MYSYMKNGNIQKCTIIFNRLNLVLDLLDFEILQNLLKLFPSNLSLIELLPLLRQIFIYSLNNYPDFLSYVIDWLYNYLSYIDVEKCSECFLKKLQNFTKQIYTIIQRNNSKNALSQRHFLKDGCIEKIGNLISSIEELMELRQDFKVKLFLIEYLEDPKVVIKTLLKKVALNKLTNFIQNVLPKYAKKYKLDLDENLLQYIKEISLNKTDSWENTVNMILPFIRNKTLQLETVLVILETANVPWTPIINNLAVNAAKDIHPLAKVVQNCMDDIPWKLLNIKYEVTWRQSFDDNEIIWFIRKILLANKTEMLDDINFIIDRNFHVKDRCYVVCFFDFIRKGKTSEALKLIENTSDIIVERCFRIISSNLECTSNIDENCIEILNTLLLKLKNIVQEYQYIQYECNAKRIKTFYILKTQFSCSNLTYDFDMNTLLPELIQKIVEDFSENKINKSEAIKKCEILSQIVDIKIEECLFEFAKQSNNLESLIYTAEIMIQNDCTSFDLCSMAIYIIQNLFPKQDASSNNLQIQLKSKFDPKFTNTTSIIKAFQIVYELAIKATLKADETENLTAYRLISWTNILFWFNCNKKQLLPKYLVSSALQPNLAAPSLRICRTIQKVFEMFLEISGNEIKTSNAIVVINYRNEETFSEKYFEKLIENLEEIVQQLHVEGYDIISYLILNTIKRELLSVNINYEASDDSCYKINAILNEKCISPLLCKIYASDKYDNQLALNLMLNTNFKPKSWFHAMIKTHRNDIEKLQAISFLAINYFTYQNESFNAYLSFYNRCKWLKKCSFVSTQDMFQLEPADIIIKCVSETEQFTLKLLLEFCDCFNLNAQKYLPIFLKNNLRNWKPKIEIIKVSKSEEVKSDDKIERKFFEKCFEIIDSIEEKFEVMKQLELVWQEISYYQYEVYSCILNLLKTLDNTCLHTDKKMVLIFLKKYRRESKPHERELKEWRIKYPFSREIDPLSKYRLPYFLTLVTKDLWEIIRPEVNLFTYENWILTAKILQLDKNDICTYAIKGTINSGVLNSNDQNWVITSRNEDILKQLDTCVSRMTNLEMATAALYQIVCTISRGADQVYIAKMCWKKALQWKKNATSAEVKNDVISKVTRKYIECLSLHILYSNDLGKEKYMILVENTEQLIRALYNDEDIIEKSHNFTDVNFVVDEFCRHFNIDAAELRRTLIMEYLQENDKNVKETLSNNLKRVIYICESSHKEMLQQMLLNIVVTNCDETVSVLFAANDLASRINALQCLIVVGNNEELETILGQIPCLYLEKLQILNILEQIGITLSVEELDEYDKNDLIRVITQNNSMDCETLPIQTRKDITSMLAKLCGNYSLRDDELWDKVLEQFVKKNMIFELEKWLPKLYGCCYKPGIECIYSQAWNFLITNTFSKALQENQNYNHGLLLIENCPIISKLESHIFEICQKMIDKGILSVCAILSTYIQNKELRTDILKDIKCYNTAKLWTEIEEYSLQGVLNTDFAISILKDLNQQ